LKPFQTFTPLGLTATLVVIPAQFMSALPAPTISQMAKKITVLVKAIDGNGNNTFGSGVIIKRQGNTYTLLSARHVLNKGFTGRKIRANDGQEYAIDPGKIRLFPKNIDLAVVEFTSTANYPVADVGSSAAVTEGSSIFVAGFPAPTGTIENSTYMFRKGDVVANSTIGVNRKGYGMIYTANTLPGMSGGGVFDEKGKLVAVHGQGDVDSKFVGDSSNPDIRFKTGNDLGIPIDIFVANAGSVLVDTGLTVPTVVAAAPKASDYYVSATNKKEEENYQGAIDDYTKAIALDPKFAKAYNDRGLMKSQLNRKNEALTDITQAIQLDPNLVEAYLNRANLSFVSNPQQAITDAKKALAIKPQEAEAYLSLSFSYLTLKDSKNAILALEQGVQIVSSEDKAFLMLMRMILNSRGNDLVGMKKSARDIIDLKSSTLDHKALGAYFLVISGEEQEAKSVAKKLIVEYPRSATPNWTAGTLELFSSIKNSGVQDAFKKAAPYYEKAILADQRSDLGYSARQITRQLLGNLTGSLADANKVLQISPKKPVAYFNRGIVNWEMGKFQAALVDFNQAIKLHQPILTAKSEDDDEIELNKNIYYYRGATYEKLNKYSQALSDYTVAVQENGAKDSLVGVKIGFGFSKNKLKRTAKYQNYSSNRSGIISDMNFYSVLASRGKMKIKLGNKVGGMQDLNQAVKVKSGPSAYFQRGLVRLKDGDKAGAIADLQIALIKAKEAKIPKNIQVIQAELRKLGIS
jgi:tetratricopeptide (TPR) repeat protein